MGEKDKMSYKSRREILENLRNGVIRYETEYGCTYLVVKEVRNGKICGQMASPIGVNSISIEDILKKNNLEIARWEEI